MDSDGNINPHKKQFKRTPALSAEDIHRGVKTPPAADVSEAEAINALAEEVVSMAKANDEPINADPLDENTTAFPDNSSSPSPDISPSAGAVSELYPEPSMPTFGAPDEIFSTPEPASEPTPEPTPEPTSEPASELTPEITPEPAPESPAQAPAPEEAPESFPEPLSDADTVVAPEPILASDTPAAPASASPEPVAVNFSVPFPSASATSAPSTPTTPAPTAPAPATPTNPAVPAQSADATVSQGIVNTPPKKSPITSILIAFFTLVLLASLGFLVYIIVIEPQLNNKNFEPTPTSSADVSTDQSLICILPSNSADSPDETYTSAYQKISINYQNSSFQDLLVENSYTYRTYDGASAKLAAASSAYANSLKSISLNLDPFYSSFAVDPSSPSSDPDETYSAVESHYVTSDELTAKNAALINFPLTASKALATDLTSVETAYSDLNYSCKTSNKLLTLAPETTSSPSED